MTQAKHTPSVQAINIDGDIISIEVIPTKADSSLERNPYYGKKHEYRIVLTFGDYTKKIVYPDTQVSRGGVVSSASIAIEDLLQTIFNNKKKNNEDHPIKNCGTKGTHPERKRCSGNCGSCSCHGSQET